MGLGACIYSVLHSCLELEASEQSLPYVMTDAVLNTAQNQNKWENLT